VLDHEVMRVNGHAVKNAPVAFRFDEEMRELR
jgi:hypothetical protein